MANKKNDVKNVKNNEKKNNVKNENKKNDVKNVQVINNVIEKANEILAPVSKNIREANKEHFSISRVLKDMQREAEMNKGYKVAFEAVGYDTTKALTASIFFGLMPESMYKMDKKGKNKRYGVYGYKIEKDEKGNEISRTPIVKTISSWSPSKVLKMLAQAKAIKEGTPIC